MLDIKTILIGAGMLYVLLSCSGINAEYPRGNSAAQPQASNAPTVDPATCYAQIHGAVRDDWAQLNQAQRLIIGIKSIQACEVQP